MNHYFYNVAANLHRVNDDINFASKIFNGHVDYHGFFRYIETVKESGNKFRMRNDAVVFLKNAVSKYVKNETFPYDVIVSFTSYPGRFLSDGFHKFLDGVTS